MKARLLRAAIGIVLVALSVLLGRYLGQEPDSDAWMPLEHALVGVAQPLAVGFTWLCYPAVLVPLGVGLLVVALVRREWLGRIALLLASMLVSWRLADALQRVFARPRRDDWVYKHELSFSYPSSHAAITFGFYVFLGVLVAMQQSGPRRGWVVLTTGLLAAGILWSRLALGAHYATDLLGGILVGSGSACFLSAFLSI